MKFLIVIVSLWAFIAVVLSQEYSLRLQSQLTAKSDDVPYLDFILNSLFHVVDGILRNGKVTYVYKTTAVYLLPMKKVYAYHIDKRSKSMRFSATNRVTYLAGGNIFLEVQSIHDTQDHIAEIKYEATDKMDSNNLLTLRPIPDNHESVLIAGFKEDGTPIIQRAYIDCKDQGPSEIHVSLNYIAVCYESNKSLNYTMKVGDLLIQGSAFLGFFMKKIPQRNIAVFATFETLY